MIARIFLCSAFIVIASGSLLKCPLYPGIGSLGLSKSLLGGCGCKKTIFIPKVIPIFFRKPLKQTYVKALVTFVPKKVLIGGYGGLPLAGAGLPSFSGVGCAPPPQLPLPSSLGCGSSYPNFARSLPLGNSCGTGGSFSYGSSCGC